MNIDTLNPTLKQAIIAAAIMGVDQEQLAIDIETARGGLVHHCVVLRRVRRRMESLNMKKNEIIEIVDRIREQASTQEPEKLARAVNEVLHDHFMHGKYQVHSVIDVCRSILDGLTHHNREAFLKEADSAFLAILTAGDQLDALEKPERK